ncbi:MAG: hypothetical protein AB1696_03280 [Planctomycetota bacterium]
MKLSRIVLAALIVSGANAVLAFNGHIVTEGPLTLTIGPIEEVTDYDAPRDVEVSLKNSSDFPLKIRLQMRNLVDEWRAVGNAEATVDAKPNEESKTTFRIAAGEGACSALYPVHVYATFEHEGKEIVAHAVQVFESNFKKEVAASTKPAEMETAIVPGHGALPLYPLRSHRVTWCYYDKPLVYMPVGWQGSAPDSRANFARQPVARGVTKPALQMHPPWQPGGGSIFAEYRVKLPDEKPIKLLFANAIRDSAPTEPKSDGVTFSVWIGDEKVFDRHSDSKVWLDGEADLSKFAGKEVLLRLESHPGPNRNTTCDSCYWGEPVVVAGEPPAQLTDEQRATLRERARKAVGATKGAGDDELVFALEDGCVAAIVLGVKGLADAAIAFGKENQSVVFDGLSIEVLQHKVGQWPSQIALREVKVDKPWLFGNAKITHRVQLGDERFDVTAELWQEKAGLRVRVTSPKRITDIALGPADRKAPKVYYGHGYCIVEPEAFSAGFGGHNLATSHVGFEFENGVSLLTACDSPPDRLEVNPDQNIYALHTHMDTMFTFVPSVKSALDCAIKYRPMYDKKAAGGVKRKAGRFVFDIWGGRYAEIAERMQRAIDYGLTDSLLTVHNWQRWGYDYRLPDIYPPNPQFGSLKDMQKIAEVCKKHDIPWGLHDNYIDFYPDAEEYTYNHICFTEGGGQPIKAWINEGRDAQSYRWRPDCIMPFVKRNLKLVKPNLGPSHYFIDVFTSAKCFDFYDRAGDFHPSTETRKCWGEAFAWIRDYLGGNAPTTSEAGHDQLIGYLDGADCQHLQLTRDTHPPGKRHWFYIRLLQKDWERVPWFDAVLHDKFSLHGVGYSGRYQGDRSRRDHGIESDDYISAEILFGHAMMTDSAAFGQGAVRKYWLAQDFIHSIALDEIVDAQFVDNDIHRQIVIWKSGAKVCVNRSEKDWTIEGKVLPQYGYYAKNGEIESSIERIGGVIVEQSRGPSGFYVNGRGYDTDDRLRIQPLADRVEYLGDRKFKLLVNWQAERPAPKDLHIFVHFDSPQAESKGKIAFQGDHTPKPGTSTWKGRITTGADKVVTIPEGQGPGEYQITTGLWEPGGKRYGLRGDDTGGSRYLLGKLIVEGEGTSIKGVRLVKHEPKPEPPPRRNVDKKSINFGPVTSCGAFRWTVKEDMIILTPLPDMDPFDVTLMLDKITGGRDMRAQSVTAVDASGKQTRPLQPQQTGTALMFRTVKGDFAYQIVLIGN